MNGLARLSAVLLIACSFASAADDTVAKAVQAGKDVPLQADPALAFWRGAIPVYLEKDTQGEAVPKLRGQVRIRWTKSNLYLLFACPYELLYLKAEPETAKETNKLWNWDVAEAFIGSDFQNIKRYKEFEVSPQAEWIDLDIDLDSPHHEDGWVWNSGFEVAARTDEDSHTWYAAMKIPYAAIDTRPAAIGNTLRMNLFRSQGPPNHHQEITWQPPMAQTFHTPEKFGTLELVGAKK
jgi:hypothetical protein